MSQISLSGTSQRPESARWSIANFALGNRAILTNGEIVLPQGGIILLTGGNGTGKSTLLRALAGLAQPWSGVSVSLSGNAADGLIRTHFSPQPPKLVDELTVGENLRLMIAGGGTVGVSSLLLAKRLLGLLGFRAKQLKGRAEVLSGGEAAMVALVGASLCSADILLLDEPFESLSSESVERAVKLLKIVLATGKRVIASTHNTQLIGLIEPPQIINLSQAGVTDGHWEGRPLS